jgi:hypothetical protein
MPTKIQRSYPLLHGDMTALEIKEYCKKKIYNFITATYYPLVDKLLPKTGMQ